MEQLKYNFFKYDSFKNMIEKMIESGYYFASFLEAGGLIKQNKPFILMRHDVDISLKSAIILAEIESKLNIKSTFFILLRTENYNIFSKHNSLLIKKIINMGHYLGLHFDCSSYSKYKSIADLRDACDKECNILENWFNTPISIISYHRPNKLILSGIYELSSPRKHTYMPLFTKRIKYFSDSRCRWKNGLPIESKTFKNKNAMHILCHPIWYTQKEFTPQEKLNNFILKKNDILKNSISTNCEVYNSTSII